MIEAWALLIVYMLGGQLVEVRVTEGLTIGHCAQGAQAAEDKQRATADGRRVYTACLPVAGQTRYKGVL